MRESTSEYGILVLFNRGGQALLPLGTKDKLASPDFPIPITFIMGVEDWMRILDEDYG